MARLKRLMTRMTKPLKAAEWVVPIAILTSAFISITETLVVDEHENSTSSVSQLIEQFEIVSLLLGVLGVFAVVHLVAMFALENHKTLRARQIALFAYSVGLSFIGVLTMTAFGILHLLWVNEFALASISAILYLHLRVTLNECQR